MRRKKIWPLGLVACLSLAIAGFADHKGKPHGKKDGDGGDTIPVSVTFRDCKDGVPSVAFALLHLETAYQLLCPTPNDRLRSDGMGSYTDGARITGVKGRFGFGIVSTKSQPATRRLFVDFSDCDPRETCTSTPLPPTFDPPSFSSLVGEHGAVNWWTRGIDFREMLVGDVGTRNDLRMGVTIAFSLIKGGQWSVRFAGADSEVCPDSDTVTVTRTAVDTWVIEADRNDIACLTEWKGGLQERGLYHMPLLITVVCEDPTQCVAPSP